MLKDQCISVTDLRKNTKQCLSGLDKHPKYLFLNNKIIAVVLDVDQYEELFYETAFEALPLNEVTPEIVQSAKRAKKIPRNELRNL